MPKTCLQVQFDWQWCCNCWVQATQTVLWTTVAVLRSVYPGCKHSASHEFTSNPLFLVVRELWLHAEHPPHSLRTRLSPALLPRCGIVNPSPAELRAMQRDMMSRLRQRQSQIAAAAVTTPQIATWVHVVRKGEALADGNIPDRYRTVSVQAFEPVQHLSFQALVSLRLCLRHMDSQQACVFILTLVAHYSAVVPPQHMIPQKCL